LVLYVPISSFDSYKVANEWQKFYQNNNLFEEGSAITPIKTDNISIQTLSNSIVVDTKEQTLVSIYNLSSQRVHESLVFGKTKLYLNKGVYIVKVKDESVKIIVP
jgi:hypothetical protein